MHFYTDNDNFPTQVSLIDDSDTPNATNFNTAPEGLADRTKFLAERTLVAGRIPAAPVLSVPGDLTAITSPANLDSRVIPGYGMYVYNSGASGTSDGLYQVNGNGGVGRWQILDHANQGPRWIKSETVVFNNAAAIDLSTVGTTNDPGNRYAGHDTNVGHAVCTSSNFTLLANDTLDISWTLNFVLQQVGPTTAAIDSDPVIGVGGNASGTGALIYLPDTIDRFSQVSADTDTGQFNHGYPQQGIFVAGSPGVNGDRAFTFNRRAVVAANPLGTGTVKLVLAISCNTLANGLVFQGSSLTVIHYRNLIA